MSGLEDSGLTGGRYRVAGKRNDEENAKEKLFTYATYVPVESFKVRPPYGSGPITFSSRLQGLETVVVDSE